MVQVILGLIIARIYRILDQKKQMPNESVRKGSEPSNAHAATQREQAAAGTIMVTPLDIELIKGKTNIHESMKALSAKYHLVSVTLAAKDGLVVASSMEMPDENGAQYSYLYFNGIEPQNRMVRLFGVNYNGEELACIVRLKQQIPGEWYDAIRNETGDILTWWL
jgi:hypothetical protein